MPGCQNGSKTYTSCTLNISFDPKTSKGTLTVAGQNKSDASPSTLLTTDVVVGGTGHLTPTGTFHAARWEKDHTSKLYGSLADTPYSKTWLGGNAFGPFQLHIRELESRGIYIHGTMGPSWNPSTMLNGLVSSTSHGCVRMNNVDNIKLHDLMPHPEGNTIIIKANPTP